MPLAAVNCWPPTLMALTDISAGAVSSSKMVPDAAAMAMVVPALGADSVTVKPSLASAVVSPATLMVTSLLASPAAKLTVPVGNAAPVVSPERVTQNVNDLLPALPSALLASVAAIANDGFWASSLTMVPVAAAVEMVVPALG